MAKYIKTFENHNAYVAYSGNSELFVKPNLSYCIQQDEVHFTSIKIPTSMELKVIIDGQSVLLNICFEPILEDCLVNVYIDNELFEVINITDGMGHIFVNDLANGMHTIYVEFSGNSQYKPCRASTSFTVSKLDSSINVTVIEDGEVRVEVPEEATGQVSASVLGGQTYYSNVIEGKTTFDFSKLLPSGTYSVTFQYLGDETYNSSNSVTETIIIPKPGTNIE